jgi:hypothetical protein
MGYQGLLSGVADGCGAGVGAAGISKSNRLSFVLFRTIVPENSVANT